MLLPVETFHDESTNTVYTTTDRMGTYCLVDMEIFLDNLDMLMRLLRIILIIKNAILHGKAIISINIILIYEVIFLCLV